MTIRRRLFLAALGVAAATFGNLARAEDLPHPLVVYDDELKNGFQNWSWTTVEMGVPVGNGKPIRVEGDPWSALALHHEPFSTKGYTKLVFYVNGGAAGGQSIMIKTMLDKKMIETDYAIQPKAKTWAVVEVPLKDINAADKTIDTLVWQGKEAAYPRYYITRIQLE